MKLVGECNLCGLCCSPHSAKLGRRLVCGHLTNPHRIGDPEATSCFVYVNRYNGMPIKLYDSKTMAFVADSVCLKDSPEETNAIIMNGIGKGCSLEVVDV